jgi:RNA polymerase sigma factor (sigma-70 family)
MNKHTKVLSDKELIQNCITKNRYYQEVLYRRYASNMFKVCYSYAQDEAKACDIMQEGFIKVFKNLHRFNFQSSLHAWIRRIMVNTALDAYRKQKRIEIKLASYKTISATESYSFLGQINAKDIMKLIEKLPTKAGTVLKLYAIEGYQHKEIAQKLAISEGTSKSQLHRARLLLKNLLSKFYDT